MNFKLSLEVLFQGKQCVQFQILIFKDFFSHNERDCTVDYVRLVRAVKIVMLRQT